MQLMIPTFHNPFKPQLARMADMLIELNAIEVDVFAGNHCASAVSLFPIGNRRMSRVPNTKDYVLIVTTIVMNQLDCHQVVGRVLNRSLFSL